MYPETEPGSGRRYWRVCAACEHQLRVNEWEKMTPEERGADPNYATFKQLQIDLDVEYGLRTPHIQTFNVCRAKTGVQKKGGGPGACGLAFPSKMWEQPDERRWKFKCNVDWKPLLKEAAKNPDDDPEGLDQMLRQEVWERHAEVATDWMRL